MAASKGSMGTVYFTAAISAAGSLKDFTKEIEKQAKPLEDTLGEGTKKGFSKGTQEGIKTLEKGLNTAGKRFNKTLKGIAVAGGAAITAGLGVALSKGYSRLVNIEEAEAKLDGLGHTQETVTKIMDNALKSVEGTAFGLDSAATSAASAVAAGIKPGQELTDYLALTADVATIAGSSFEEMGSIFNKVATSGKIQGDVIAQLGDRGIPVVQLLAESLGVTAGEVTKMASAGKISSEDFLKAMGSMEGAAKKSGDTTTGSLANMWAALGRVGVTLQSGIFPLLQPLFSEFRIGFDLINDQLKPIMEGFNETFGPKMAGLIEGLGEKIGAGAGELFEFLKGIGPILTAIKDGAWNSFAVQAQVIQNIFEILAPVLTVFAKLMESNPELVANVVTAVVLLNVAFGALGSALNALNTLAPIFNLLKVSIGGLFSFIAAHPVILVLIALAAVVYLIATNWDVVKEVALSVFETIGSALTTTIDWVVAQWDALWGKVSSFFAWLGDGVSSVAQSISDIFMWAVDNIAGRWQALWGGISTGIENAKAWVGGFIDGLVSGFTTGVDKILGIFTTIGDGIVGVAKFIANGWISYFNLIISGINFLVRGLNNIKFDAPNWVPGFGGQSFGFSVPEVPSIPSLATGGLVTKPTVAVVGDNKNGEYITDRGVQNRMMEEMTLNLEANRGLLGDTFTGDTDSKSVNIVNNITVENGGELDIDELAEKLAEFDTWTSTRE